MARQHNSLRAGPAFALGLVTGMMLKEVVKRLLEQARLSQWHHDYTATEDYDENLPESLGRREPPPEPGQARYGGTGALGVHPAAATARSEESTARDTRAKG